MIKRDKIIFLKAKIKIYMLMDCRDYQVSSIYSQLVFLMQLFIVTVL